MIVFSSKNLEIIKRAMKCKFCQFENGHSQACKLYKEKDWKWAKETWEINYDKGINKILKENSLPATASFLIVFSKWFIRQEKQKWLKDILPRKISGKNKEYCEGFNDCRDSIIKNG